MLTWVLEPISGCLFMNEYLFIDILRCFALSVNTFCGMLDGEVDRGIMCLLDKVVGALFL